MKEKLSFIVESVRPDINIYHERKIEKQIASSQVMFVLHGVWFLGLTVAKAIIDSRKEVDILDVEELVE